MRRALPLTLLLVGLAASAAAAHDLFLKPTRFFVPINDEVRVRVLNGTFARSENSIARARLADASVLSPRGRMPLDTAEWGVRGDTSTFHVHTRERGTYVLGVSTRPSVIALSADDFNLYLESDGVPDVLAERRAAGTLDRPARERYSKHVKALVQVGDARTGHATQALGYPAELVPLENPYALRVGDTLRLRALVRGHPAPGQFVLFGGESAGGAIAPGETRADSAGIVRLPLTTAGVWYVKFIHMTPVARDSVDYESRWASVVFEVRQ